MANNIFTGRPNIVKAKQTIAFADAGLTDINTSLVFEVDNMIRSWKPSRAINPIQRMIKGRGYVVHSLVDMDKEAFFSPPADTNTIIHEHTFNDLGRWFPYDPNEYNVMILSDGYTAPRVRLGTYGSQGKIMMPLNFKYGQSIKITLTGVEVVNGGYMYFPNAGGASRDYEKVLAVGDDYTLEETIDTSTLTSNLLVFDTKAQNLAVNSNVFYIRSIKVEIV